MSKCIRILQFKSDPFFCIQLKERYFLQFPSNIYRYSRTGIFSHLYCLHVAHRISMIHNYLFKYNFNYYRILFQKNFPRKNSSLWIFFSKERNNGNISTNIFLTLNNSWTSQIRSFSLILTPTRGTTNSRDPSLPTKI